MLLGAAGTAGCDRLAIINLKMFGKMALDGATVQRLSVALQRGVQEDQLLRAHVRRTRHLFGVNDGGAPGGGAATESVVARAGAARRAECRCT